MKKLLFLMLIASFILSCTKNGPIDQAMETIQTDDMKKYVKALGSDAFLGRKPFTRGEERTLAYLEKEFQRIGLQPVQGSYYQDVPMVEVSVQPDEQMRFQTPAGSLKLKYRRDFVAFSRRLTPDIQLNETDLVFAGYGIVAPEYNWNDYKGIDVTGKTVVVLVNDPGYGTGTGDFFNGHAMTYYGRWTYKYEEAARQGAAGLMIVHETGPAGYPWNVVLNGAVIPKLYLKPDDGYQSRCAVEGWVTRDAAERLFQSLGYKYDQLKDQARQPGFQALELNGTASLAMKSRHHFANSRNIMGYLPGKERKDEVIIYSAHWDHLGVDTTLQGDSIYNGAVDNGTSLAWMLEIAEAFASLEKKPKRSVMFFAPTAEEQGLLGSKYYGENPQFPLHKTVANINNDLMLPYGRYKDVMVTGYGQSQLDDLLEKVTARHNRYIYPDPNPHTGMYYRSDHFSFARVGVPALFARGNCDSREHGREWAAEKEQFWLENRYHDPSDEYDPDTWDLAGIRDDARLFFEVGYELANGKEFPRWNDGSEFKKIREAMMNEHKQGL
jgi:Zn-dependent M28 family amino/carboxypeptidase